MTKKDNYINVSGDGNISLQDISGSEININDVAAIRQVFLSTEPQYLKDLYNDMKKQE